MEETINVTVWKKTGRAVYYMRYRCPETAGDYARSTGTTNRQKAERIAANWESDLRAGRDVPTKKMSWGRFREFYEDTVGPTLRPKTRESYSTTFNTFERICHPQKVASLKTATITKFATQLRIEGRTEATVSRHLRALKAAARWAHRQELLPKVPSFDMPKKAKSSKAKGRPITGEEFERMLAATPAVVGDRAAESWRHLLRGLWWSGLRLGEILALRWDYLPGGVAVRLCGSRSVLVFESESQKSGRDETVPLAPEAVKLIGPTESNEGYVFAPERQDRAEPIARDTHKVSKVISKIGKAAGVVVDPVTGKTASAHDLRRSFGFRWSRRVMPASLKELMRHASIETTMTYYVGHQAAETAAELWAAMPGGDSMGTPAESPATDSRKPLVFK